MANPTYCAGFRLIETAAVELPGHGWQLVTAELTGNIYECCAASVLLGAVLLA
jgi:hypothetical protein